MTKPRGCKLHVLTAWLVAFSFLLGAGLAGAASFGKMNVMSSIGQPLLAEIDLVNVTPDDLQGMSAKIASAEMFNEANIERSSSLDSVKLGIEKRENGQPFIRVSSAQAISLASLNLLIEVNWASGRLVRAYPIVLNPPKSLASVAGAGSVSPPGFVNQTPPPAPPEVKEKAVSAPPPESPKANSPPQAAATPSASPVAPSSPPLTADATREETLPAPALPAGATSPERANASEKTVKAADTPAKSRKVIKVKNGDTLTTIAAKLHPPKGMLEQTMIAVFEANRQAFIKDNVNRIRAGANLQIPDATESAAIPPEEASKRLKLMAKDFDAYRGRLASAAAARPVAAAPNKASVTGKLEGATDDAAAPVKPGANDVLKLSRSAESKKADKSDQAAGKVIDKSKSSSAIEDKLREEAIVRDNQLKEARERASILEKDVGQMRKLLQEKEALARQIEIANAKKAEEQKNAAAKLMAPPVALPEAIKPVMTEEQKEIARKESQASKEAQALKEAAARKEAEAKDAKEAEEAAAKAAQLKETGLPSNKTLSEVTEKDAKDAETEKKESAKEEDKLVAPLGRPEKKPVVTEATTDSGSAFSTLTEHPFAIAGGLASGLLIGWLGLMVLRRRRERLQDALFEPDPIDPISHSVAVPEIETATEQPKAVKIAETIKGFAESDSAEALPPPLRQDVDPIEEADVYIAYGRNEQAEEILLKAIVANPVRLELVKKLLDLYAMEKRLPDYAQGFTKLQSLAPAGSTLLAAARRMGAEIDPSNPLYSMVAPSAPVAPSPSPLAAPPLASPPAAVAAANSNLAGIDLDVTTEGPAPIGGREMVSAPSVSASSIVPPIPGETATAPTSFADINLDLDQATETPPAERGPEWQAVATQLDLARAYLEIEDKDNARDLLNEVLAKGDAAQRGEAERILAELG